MSQHRSHEERNLKHIAIWPREGYQATTAEDGRTHESFAKACDINNILAKYKKSGLVDHVQNRQGNYQDLSEPVDFETAMLIVTNAQTAFMELPSEIRSRFGNDPGSFLDYATNPDNEAGMRELGLLPRKTAEQNREPGTGESEAETTPAPAAPPVEPEPAA